MGVATLGKKKDGETYGVLQTNLQSVTDNV